MFTNIKKPSQLNLFGSLNRIERRNLIEYYCKLATLLPVHKRMLFLLYYRDGYSTVEIAQLLMKNAATVSRRLKKIAEELYLLQRKLYGKATYEKVEEKPNEKPT